MKDSLQWLLDKFPVFLNKNTDSNFYKSTTVLNSNLKEVWNDIFKTHLSHRLDKRVLIWKEQEEPGVYEMNFYVHLPYLKMVNVYKNDSLIYSESYEYSDEVDTFVYSLDETSENIISKDKYYVTVETWEEFVLAKGFPENDTVLDDIYDHDVSLDEFGALYDIPRKTYTYTENTNPANTEPHYNNRLTEDDYHYMNRILGYISHMQDTPLPVLEIWKLFGIPLDKISLINRERYLCKMYSSVKHGGDDWTPKPWEHKDPMGCYWPEPVFFFVEVDNHSPVLGQSIYFRYTFMNMYGEDKGKDYLVDVYLDDDKIAEDVDPSSVWEFDTTGCDDEYPLTFKFIANPLDTRADVLESDEIIITIKGCNSADWYVAVDGSDDNDGSRENPFLTLPKALSMVEGSRNVIVLKSGTFDITGLQIIDTSTSIISCQGATIRNDVNYDFFRILQECNLYLMGITLKHKCCEMYGCDDSFYNFNYTQNPVHLRINKELMCKPPVTVQVDSMTDRVYAHSNMEVDGTLLNSETEEPVPDEIIELISEEVVLDTDTTDENGEYGFSHELTTLGYHTFTLNHVESRHYCMGSTMITVSVEAMPTTLTAMMDSTVLFGDELTIAYDLTDYYGNNITDGSIVLYEDGSIVATVDAGEELDYTPSTVGTHTYKLVYDCDSTYVSSESEVFTVVVRRYETNLLLECDKSTCMPSDTVNVTGVLTDELGNRLSGQTVKLYDENTLIYTGTTNNQGIVTYSHTFTAGVHTLQWKYEQTTKYEAVNSNTYRLRVRDDVSNPINLFLYPTTRIGVSGTSVGLNVYACDEHGDPIATSFKIVDTYNGSCGVYPSTTYTTGNDGWWTGTLSTNAIVNCHGTYIQAVSIVDTDYYSNTVHVFDEAETPLTVTGDLTSSVSTFDKDTSTIPVSVSLIDESNQPLPNESFSIQLISDGTVAATTTSTTGVTGEKDLNVSVPSSVKGKDLTVRLVYNGRSNAYGSATDSISLTYIFSPVLTFTTNKSVYVVGEAIVGTCIIKDEFNNLLANKSVKLYDSTTLVDTQVSDNTGEAGYNVTTLAVGQHSLHCEFAAAGNYHSAVSSNVTVTVKIVTELEISVPLNLVYSDAFLITGTLTDISDNPLSGKTVKLIVGSTVVDTGTTDNSGVVEFTRTPVHMGTHSFQLAYDGDGTYKESSSSVVTREIGKETSVLTVTSPTDNSSIYTDESVSISGVLVSDDNEAITGKSIVVSENGTTLTTLTTDSNGAFSGSVSGLSAGTHTFKFEFVTDTYYTGSSVTRNVIVNNHTYSLTANASQSVIGVGDSVTVTGVLTKDGNTWSGQTVTIYDGVTVIDTVTTDSNGAYSKTVTGLSLGAHSLKAVNTNAESSTVSVNVYNLLVATFSGNSVSLGQYNYLFIANSNILIDWGDGSTETISKNVVSASHSYTDGVNSHTVRFIGDITGIGSQCFYNCTGLTSINIPNTITSIGESCFWGCSGLTSITIPNSVTTIGDSSFRNCSGLTSVVLPNGITSLKSYCFSGCSSLTDIVIPDSVTIIGDCCFYGCSSLTSIVIPDNVTSLGNLCFQLCHGLTSVVIPDSVASLGTQCFYGCSALIDYDLYWEDMGIIAYDSNKMPNNTDTLFIVPVGEISNYETAGYPSAKLVERGDTITLTADKPIIQSSETSTITAKLIHDGRVASGETLTYQIKHGSTVIDSGSDVTDSNGEVEIQYTGTSVGQVDVVVSYGMLLQETFVIRDCTFIDYAIDGQKNSNWNKGSALSVSTGNDGTTFTSSSSTANSGRYIETTGLTGDFIIEWKMKASYGIRCGVSNATNDMAHSTYFMTNSEYTEFRDWKIECINGVITAYIHHNDEWQVVTWNGTNADTSSTLYFAFAINANGTTYTGVYKDLIIYPV